MVDPARGVFEEDGTARPGVASPGCPCNFGARHFRDGWHRGLMLEPELEPSVQAGIPPERVLPIATIGAARAIAPSRISGSRAWPE